MASKLTFLLQDKQEQSCNSQVLSFNDMVTQISSPLGCLFFIYSAECESLTFTVGPGFLFLVESINFCNLSHPVSLGRGNERGGVGESLVPSSKKNVSFTTSCTSAAQSDLTTDQTSRPLQSTKPCVSIIDRTSLYCKYLSEKKKGP